jgi:hypothetical protein
MNLVAKIPAVAVAAVTPVAALADPDPIFAAIEEYKIADAKHGEVCKAEPRQADGSPAFGTPEYAAWDAKADTACDKHAGAARQFCSTVPTTPAGVTAALRFVEERKKVGDDLTLTMKDGEKTCEDLFFASLHAATERLAGLAP